MAKKHFHRKHFLFAAGASVLAAFGLKKGSSNAAQHSAVPFSNEPKTNLARKEPRAVPSSSESTLA